MLYFGCLSAKSMQKKFQKERVEFQIQHNRAPNVTHHKPSKPITSPLCHHTANKTCIPLRGTEKVSAWLLQGTHATYDRGIYPAKICYSLSLSLSFSHTQTDLKAWRKSASDITQTRLKYAAFSHIEPIRSMTEFILLWKYTEVVALFNWRGKTNIISIEDELFYRITLENSVEFICLHDTGLVRDWWRCAFWKTVSKWRL